MTSFTQFQRCEPDTISGEKIILTQTFSSFDKQEIDRLEKMLRETIGSGRITEYKGKESE